MTSQEIEIRPQEVNANDGEQSSPPTKKRRFSMPPSIVIILGFLIFVTFLSWVLQGQNFSVEANGTVTNFTTSAVGLFSLGNQIINGFISAGDIIFYLFVLGWFLDVVLESKSLEAGINSLIKALKGKEIILVPLMFCLFAFGGTSFGMQEETLGLYIIIIPFFLMAGFDTMTGLLVILLGTTTGIASSVVNPFSVGVAYSVIPEGMGEYGIGDGLLFRLLVFAIFVTIGAIFVTTYAYRVRKNPSKSLTFDTREEDIKWANDTFEHEDHLNQKINARQKAGLIIFGSTFLLMFLMLIPWGSFFDWSVEDINNYPAWISWLLNGMNIPGEWGFGELILLFAISTVTLSIIFKMKPSKLLESFWRGSKDMLSVALLIGIARAIPGVLASSHLDLYFATNIAKGMKDISQIGWTYIMFFVFLMFATLIPSTSGLGTATIGIFAASANGIFSDAEITSVIISTVVVFAIALGIMNMIIPTQAVVMASCERARVPYSKMTRMVGVYIGIILVATLAVIIPLTSVMT